MRRAKTATDKRLGTIIDNEVRLKAAKRAAGQAGRFVQDARGKTYTNKASDAGQVAYCASCGAPVVDSDAARRGHAARCGCAAV